MEFSEETQIFLVAEYYRVLTEGFGSRGEAAFRHCVRCYGIQRGSRMAQSAIRDGQRLDYVTFCRYGQWRPSKTVLRENRCSQTSLVSWNPDYVYQVSRCPWLEAFEKFQAKEAGLLYCDLLDEAINQGFNGEIPFCTVQTMQRQDRCIFSVADAGLPRKRICPGFPERFGTTIITAPMSFSPSARCARASLLRKESRLPGR